MKLISAIGALAISTPVTAQTTLYVDWVVGNDTTGAGTASSPWKTITKALDSISGPGVTVEVAGGANRTHDASAEDFPLTLEFDNTRIVGTRARSPVIDLTNAELEFSSGMQAAILVEQSDGCEIRGIDIDAGQYDKVATSIPGAAASGIAGIAVGDLPAGGSLEIVDCKVDDLFNGIFFVDTPSYVPGQRRSIEITSCEVSECGPWGGANGSDLGHAGIRLLEADSSDMDLYITSCDLASNHDALEPGDAALLLSNTNFQGNENGLEFAATTDAHAYVLGCSFVENRRFPFGQGGVSAPTGGIMMRFPNSYDLTVRGCDFIDNQFGASLRGAQGVSGSIDFGDGVGGVVTVFPTSITFITANGDNTFEVNPTCPWSSLESHYVTYCGLFSTLDTTVQAVGNTWSYVDFSDPMVTACSSNVSDCLDTPTDLNCSQGVSPNGLIQTPSLTFGPGQNFDVVTGDPFPRPLDTDPLPQQVNTPRSFATGLEYFNGGIGSGLPAIRLSTP